MLASRRPSAVESRAGRLDAERGNLATVPITIRTARADDADAVARLLTELGYPTSPSDVPRRLARMLAEPGQHVFIAETDAGQVVGLATLLIRHMLTTDAPFGRVSALVVAEQARRTGVGGALMEQAEDLARAAGCDRMEVTSAERRADAHAFYEAIGYAESRRRFFKALTSG
jgi:GNAT superfamily N-acetyltransferase